MISFSNCKINIGLHITGKRPDGFHNLETIFFPVPIYDVLELIESEQPGITISGHSIPGDPEKNLVLTAWQLLKKDFPHLPAIHFHLLKNTPPGAGLGAGSANGAFALKTLNARFELGLTDAELIAYALQLGSDCPFFIINRPVFAQGRGEVFEKIAIDLSGHQVIIVNPGIHIPTPWAFRQITPRPAMNLKESIQQPVSAWKDLITNDFETPVLNAYPEIAAIKQTLYGAGAVFSLMSGSGSTVYGLFAATPDEQPEFPENYFVKSLPL